MAITLGGVSLPNGLVWSDEFDWITPQVDTAYTLTGAMIVQLANKQAGRSITLTGGVNFSWLNRTQLLAVKSVIDTCPDTGMVLTLHDARLFNVVPASDCLSAQQVPLVMDSGIADPSTTTNYYISYIKLIEV
jgi:hypothetical protein